MIRIIKSEEPDCLKQFREVPENKYEHLQGECLSLTRNLLFSDQNGLCAYCQRRLTSTTFIEHYIPQTKAPEKELDFSIFLGVCSGKYYVNKKTGKHIKFCSHLRGSEDLTVDPLKKTDIETLYYDENNKIFSSNQAINDDLKERLNLNFDELCEDRQKSYDNLLKNIIDLGSKQGLSKIEIFKKALNVVKTKNPSREFNGFLIYRLEKTIDYLANKQN